MPLAEALKIAHDANLDLVLIAPTANPPVCKTVDYSKFRYEAMRKAKENRKKQKTTELKEVQLSATIAENDMNTKAEMARKFLAKGNKVKVDIFFKGRAILYKEQGEAQLLKFAEALLEYGKPEQMPKLEGKRMLMLIAPKK